MRRSPTVTLLVVLVLVFLLQQAAGVVGIGVAAFTLALPLDHAPWTLPLSIYSHASVTHLVVNGVALLVLGVGIERVTTPLRFHAFFLLTGVAAAVTEVVVAALLGNAVSVLGASGAVFALFGYALTGNALARGAFARVSPRLQFVVLGVLAVGVTLATSSWLRSHWMAACPIVRWPSRSRNRTFSSFSQPVSNHSLGRCARWSPVPSSVSGVTCSFSRPEEWGTRGRMDVSASSRRTTAVVPSRSTRAPTLPHLPVTRCWTLRIAWRPRRVFASRRIASER